MNAHVLAPDIAGSPFDWVPAQDAVLYYATGKVAWELGEQDVVFRGDYSRTAGKNACMNCVTPCRVHPQNRLLLRPENPINVSRARSTSPARTSNTYQYALLVQ
jgi:hypothetical protein